MRFQFITLYGVNKQYLNATYLTTPAMWNLYHVGSLLVGGFGHDRRCYFWAKNGGVSDELAKQMSSCGGYCCSGLK